ncbi:DUF4235 domain-containing protein [Neorhodopirellula pilleata]|uniref:DUF4235 domain-containing protein n=1 Tax=Neorhodopirellula pilleata TaxID=2714738 RepID=A0A5C6ATD4_9BACT|nr:DUF4235 domain-containing protein [Neorhodopirellula pilleata]TWU01404.1 hypothetical protein Pla100_11310 [Neorhodopirellula pilleata]
MIDSLQEKLEAAHHNVQEKLGREPDGRNAGIGKTENLMAFGAAIAATFLARNALQASWKFALNREPPKNPASSEVDWKDALLWGAVSGACVGMVRIASRRASSSAYRSWRSPVS